MKNIVERLHDNRQIELAKSILEANGYKVSKIHEDTFAPNLDIPELDFSHIAGASKPTKDSPILFDDTKGALKYTKAQGMELRKRNNLSSDAETEAFCNQLRDKLIANATGSGKINRYSKEYKALRVLASTLKGHTTSSYGMTTAYVDIRKKSPYSAESMEAEL